MRWNHSSFTTLTLKPPADPVHHLPWNNCMLEPSNEQETQSRGMEAYFELPALTLNQRQLCDIELLLNGAFAPLSSFMNRVDYETVLTTMRLANGVLWPMPITLDVSHAFAGTIHIGEAIALYDPEGLLIAKMIIED